MTRMQPIWITLLCLACAAGLATAQLRPDQVLVVYDSRVADSIAVAEHYAGSANVPGGPSGSAPGARPGVRVVDLASLGRPVLQGSDLPVATYLSDLRDPLRGYLESAGLVFDVRCLVLTKGLPHRILDLDDPQALINPDVQRPIGDIPESQLSERLAGDASAASVDSELTLLWQDTLDTELSEPGDSLADGAIKNPYHTRLVSINTFSNANIRAAKSIGSIEGTFFTQGAVGGGLSPSRFTAGDILLVTRLDGNTVEDVRAMIDRAADIVFDPTRDALILDESGSEGVQDRDDNDDEFDNLTLVLGANDDYEATRDALLADGRFAPGLIRYDPDAGPGSFFVGGEVPVVDANPAFVVAEPLVLFASLNENHGGGVPGGPATAREIARTFDYRPGAIFNTIESFNGRGLNGLATLFNQEQAADFVGEGGTLAVASVYEPISDSVPDNEWLVRNFVLGGMTWAEAAWSSIPAVSWMQIVLGDPLAMARLEVEVVCSPADLARRFGVLDELDVREALERFTAGDATADFDASGALDIFDLILFFELFDAGCG
ncbi:MAG: hypothetical protein AAFR38_13590 [Planctomycetota bacterium]